MATVENRDGAFFMRYEAGGEHYDISLSGVPEAQHNRLTLAVWEHATDIYKKAVRQTENETRKGIREALGIETPALEE